MSVTAHEDPFLFCHRVVVERAIHDTEDRLIRVLDGLNAGVRLEILAGDLHRAAARLEAVPHELAVVEARLALPVGQAYRAQLQEMAA